jgi:hypothetical protein
VLNATLYVAERGRKWRGVPRRFGRWHTIHTCMNRCSKAGVLDKGLEKLQAEQMVRAQPRRSVRVGLDFGPDSMTLLNGNRLSCALIELLRSPFWASHNVHYMFSVDESSFLVPIVQEQPTRCWYLGRIGLR